MENTSFIDKKYSNLAGSHEVDRAVIKARSFNERHHTREERIDAYLTRLGNIMEDEKGFEHLKYKVLQKYVTKPEEIPESYWKLQENIMKERGQLGDWNNADEEEKENLKRINSEGILSDQKASLEQWLDYFHSDDSSYLPDDLKYWVFRNVINLQEFDKEKQEFPKRSKGTVKQFPDINQEALSYVIDALQKKLKGEGQEFEYDIQQNERSSFNEYLTKEDFAKLYAWANTLMNPASERLLQITEGEWRKFNQGSDEKELTKTLRGKGTGWCTAGEQTAKTS